MAGKKTSKTAAHGAPSPDDDPNEDGAPISEADVAKKRSKLILELVNERKKVEVLNKDIMKRVKEHATSVTMFLSVIALRDETILTKEVLLAQQKASVETYKVRHFQGPEKGIFIQACCSQCCSSSSVRVEEERSP